MRNIFLILALCLGGICLQAQNNAAQNNSAQRKLAVGTKVVVQPAAEVHTGTTTGMAKKRTLTDAPPGNAKPAAAGAKTDTTATLQKQTLTSGKK